MKLLIIFTLLSLLSASTTLAQVSRRAAEPAIPGPTGSPNSARYLQELKSYQDAKRGPGNSEEKKIVGVGHYADEVPLDNAERMRKRLPLKPPTRRSKNGNESEQALARRKVRVRRAL
ncbi:uncharacterized protein I303_106817 [Kwoniella dejecticola CBS 10117]|uniref:Uncharacterized protein n=1 Tax=Kwoniella dejecticola CBS 10117 TaxID=1296121 RepID=A0A1A5ZTL3_9TREE|nr:uncharacterized protein I303_08540 [Kwoniella dejecticola CBS 10117]OBR81156.1 hypothetical protein I303_08540 [Kwoniella dejecticola CBS 10117]